MSAAHAHWVLDTPPKVPSFHVLLCHQEPVLVVVVAAAVVAVAAFVAVVVARPLPGRVRDRTVHSLASHSPSWQTLDSHRCAPFAA